MGGIRDIAVHPSGEWVVAVSVGRFAYVFNTRKKDAEEKIYLKKKLCSVLFFSEPMLSEAEREKLKEKEENAEDKGSDNEAAFSDCTGEIGNSDAEEDSALEDGLSDDEDQIDEGF